MIDTFNPILVMTIFVMIILLWPRLMHFSKKIFLERLYFYFTPSLTYFQTKAIFENVFYFVIGLVGILLIAFISNIQITGFEIYQHGDSLFFLKIIFDAIILLLICSAAIFTWAGFLLPLVVKSQKLSNLDFRESWMETYTRLNPLSLVLLLVFLPILTEELFFRVMMTTVLLDYLSFMNTFSIPFTVSICTVLFIVQQTIMLKNKTQIIAIGISAFWLGIINSTALILGASFYSILISHYIFVVLTVMSNRTKTKSMYGSYHL
jgi:hypothetical protein